MKAPRRIELIVAADEPALFFDSATSAAEYLEAIDVKHGVYGAAWGRRGEPYRVKTVGDRVVIVPDPTKAPDPEGLRRVLINALRQAMPSAELDADLVTLLLSCEPFLEQ